MIVNDDTGCLTPRGACATIASVPQAGTRSYSKFASCTKQAMQATRST